MSYCMLFSRLLPLFVVPQPTFRHLLSLFRWLFAALLPLFVLLLLLSPLLLPLSHRLSPCRPPLSLASVIPMCRSCTALQAIPTRISTLHHSKKPVV